jgi:hypothetical protein
MQLEENETAVNNPNKEVYTLDHCFKAQISKLMAKKYVGKCRELKGHTYKTGHITVMIPPFYKSF